MPPLMRKSRYAQMPSSTFVVSNARSVEYHTTCSTLTPFLRSVSRILMIRNQFVISASRAVLNATHAAPSSATSSGTTRAQNASSPSQPWRVGSIVSRCGNLAEWCTLRP